MAMFEKRSQGMPIVESQTVMVSFAAHLQRHVRCEAQRVEAGSLAAALEQAFTGAPDLKHYVLDDQGSIRKHVAVFINGVLHRLRNDLSVQLRAGDKVHVIQALSGG